MLSKYERATPLIRALDTYQNALENGNYKNSPTRNWSDKNELDFVYNILKSLSNKLNFSIDCNALEEELKFEHPIDFFKIAHLNASVIILEKQLTVEPSKELQQFDTTQKKVWIHAGMPAPCLAYLGAIQCSSKANSSKLARIDYIIERLSKKANKFGTLDNIVLKMAIVIWMNLINKEPELKKIDIIEMKIKKFENKLNECLEKEKAIENYTGIDKYILLILKNLKNEIGSINMEEFKLSSNSEPEVAPLTYVKS